MDNTQGNQLVVGGADEPDQGGTWLIGKSPEQALLTVSVMDDQGGHARGVKIDGDHAGVDRLAPLLQTIPGLLTSHEVAEHRYLRVVVNGQLAAAADGDGLRGFVRDSSGKFTEHGRFYEDSRLQNLVNSAALFQIASAVVAQKHLADISEKLSEIKAGIDRIESFQQNQRKTKITGTLEYLRSVAPTILEGQLSSSVKVALESSEKELLEIQQHLTIDIRDIATNVLTLKDPDMLGTGGLTRAIRQEQDRLDELAEQWVLCLATRFLACRLLSVSPEEEKLACNRQQLLEQAAAEFLAENGPLSAFRQAVNSRMKSMSSLIESQSTTYANALRLRQWEEDRLPALMLNTQKKLVQLQQVLLPQPHPVVLTLKMKGQECVGAYRLDAVT